MSKINRFWLAVFALLLSTCVLASEPIRVKPRAGTVALTFDDGPDPRYTPTVLEILARHHVKATFFICGGMAKAHPAIVLAIKKAGHAIANHSWGHPNLRTLSPERVTRELENTNLIIAELTGQRPKCLRPPFAASNNQVRQIANKLGLEVLTWDMSSRDFEIASPEKEVALVLSVAKPGDVILMHDANRGGRFAMTALEPIIEGLKKRDIGFDTICD